MAPKMVSDVIVKLLREISLNSQPFTTSVRQLLQAKWMSRYLQHFKPFAISEWLLKSASELVLAQVEKPKFAQHAVDPGRKRPK